MHRYHARSLALPVLAAIGLFGLNSMFGQIYRNGYTQRVLDIMASPQPVLPGSQTPLLTQYLGLPVVDNLLMIAAVLWANVTDGSAPALSLYAIQFGGQLVPIFLVMMIEASRYGNTNNALFFSVLWGYAMQTFGYAIIMPLYCTTHLFVSDAFTKTTRSRVALAKTIAPRNPTCFTLHILVPAFSLGYFLPSFLMSWPFSSSTLHQWLGAVWQGFPLYVVLFQHVLTLFAQKSSENPAKVLSRAYDWAFGVATTTQLFTYAVILLVKIVPGLFAKTIPTELTFSNVFMPGPIYSTAPMQSMATTMHDFFKWDQYVGSAAAITWGIALDVTSRDMSCNAWVLLGWDVLRWTALAGPGGALMKLLQRRDRAILAEQAQDERKNR